MYLKGRNSMNKKIILLFICIFCLCGCSVKYELTVNDDLSLQEEVRLYEEKSFIKNNIDSSIDNGVNKIIDLYNSDEDNLGINLPNVANIDSSDSSSIYYKIFKNYSAFGDFSSVILKEYFKGVSGIKEANKYSILISNLNYDKIVSMTQKYQYKFNIDKLYFYITVPFEVTKNNADYVDGNSYIWVFSKDNYNKDIELVFTSKKKEHQKESNNIINNLISSTIESVSGGKIDGDSWLKKNKVNLYFSIILVITVVCVIIIRRKIRKANQV